MKKLIALVLAMLMLFSVAMAEVLNFGDFNLDVDLDWPGAVGDKVDGEVYLMFFPNYDDAAQTHANINVVWQDVVADVTTIDPTEFAEAQLDGCVAEYENSGIAVNNLELLTADCEELSGIPALTYMLYMECDYSKAGVDLTTSLITGQVVISQPGIGTYIFTVTAGSMEEMAELANILNTLTWNF